MPARRIGSYSNLSPIQENTINPFATFDSDVVNRLTRIVTHGKDCVLNGLEIKNSNADYSVVKTVDIFKSGTNYNPIKWNCAGCTPDLIQNIYLDGFYIRDITKISAYTIEYKIYPEEYDIQNFISKNILAKFDVEFDLISGSPRQLIVSVNNSSFTQQYPRTGKEKLKFSIIHNFLEDRCDEPISLKLTFILDPSDAYCGIYTDQTMKNYYNGQSDIHIKNLKYTCEIYNSAKDGVDYRVVNNKYSYSIETIHPSNTLYISPGLAVKDDVLLQEYGIARNDNNPCMILKLDDEKSWIKSNPYLPSDFYKDGSQQYAFVYNKPEIKSLIGTINQTTGNLEFKIEDKILNCCDDWQLTDNDLSIPYTYTATDDYVQISLSELDFSDNVLKELYGTVGYIINKKNNKIIKSIKLLHNGSEYKYESLTLDITLSELRINSESEMDDIGIVASVGPIKVSGETDLVNQEMVKWANIVIYYSYYKHPEPNVSYIGLLRDEDLNDNIYGEDYLILGRVRMISPNTFDIISYENRQVCGSDITTLASKIQYSSELSDDVRKLWIDLNGNLCTPTNVSDALTTLLKMLQDYYTLVLKTDVAHKNIVCNDCDGAKYIYDREGNILTVYKNKISINNTIEENQYLPTKLVAVGDCLKNIENPDDYLTPEYFELKSDISGDDKYVLKSPKPSCSIKVWEVSENLEEFNASENFDLYLDGVLTEYSLENGYITFESLEDYVSVKIQKNGFLDYEQSFNISKLQKMNIYIVPESFGNSMVTICNSGVLPLDLDIHMYCYRSNNMFSYDFVDENGDGSDGHIWHGSPVKSSSKISAVLKFDDGLKPEICKIDSVDGSSCVEAYQYKCIINNFHNKFYGQTIDDAAYFYFNASSICDVTDDQLINYINTYYLADAFTAMYKKDVSEMSREELEKAFWDYCLGGTGFYQNIVEPNTKVTLYVNGKVYEIMPPLGNTPYWCIFQIQDGVLKIINRLSTTDDVSDIIPLELPNEEVNYLPNWYIKKNPHGHYGISDEHNWYMGYYNVNNEFIGVYYSNDDLIPLTWYNVHTRQIVEFFDIKKIIVQNNIDCQLTSKYGALLFSEDENEYDQYVQDPENYLLTAIQNTNPNNGDNVIRVINNNGTPLNVKYFLDMLNKIPELQDKLYGDSGKVLYSNGGNDNEFRPILFDNMYVCTTQSDVDYCKLNGVDYNYIFKKWIKWGFYNNKQYGVDSDYSGDGAVNWIWDNNIKRVVNTVNSRDYSGFVSYNKLDNIDVEARFFSTGGDNDYNGFTLFVVAENGRQHSLTFERNLQACELHLDSDSLSSIDSPASNYTVYLDRLLNSGKLYVTKCMTIPQYNEDGTKMLAYSKNANDYVTTPSVEGRVVVTYKDMVDNKTCPVYLRECENVLTQPTATRAEYDTVSDIPEMGYSNALDKKSNDAEDGPFTSVGWSDKVGGVQMHLIFKKNDPEYNNHTTITCRTTPFYETVPDEYVYDSNQDIVIDLDELIESETTYRKDILQLFKNGCRWGFVNHSQAESYFEIVNMNMDEYHIIDIPNGIVWKYINGEWINSGDKITKYIYPGTQYYNSILSGMYWCDINGIVSNLIRSEIWSFEDFNNNIITKRVLVGN